MAAVVLGLFGLLFGSFGNVVVWRLPRGESLSSPPSHCPVCDAPVRWFDNVPVVSWLVLRGRCRDCAAPISVRYPLVEAASAALWAAAGVTWGLTVRGLVGAVFLYVLLLLSLIDVDIQRLPNPLVGALAIAGAIGAVAAQALSVPGAPIVGVGTAGWMASPVLVALAGALAGAGLSLGIATAYGALRGVDAMGMGDVKLLGAMGFFLGLYVLVAYMLANVLGAVFGLALAKRREGEGIGLARVPFGVFLALAGGLTAVWGPTVWTAYLRFVGLA